MQQQSYIYEINRHKPVHADITKITYIVEVGAPSASSCLDYKTHAGRTPNFMRTSIHSLLSLNILVLVQEAISDLEIIIWMY